MVGKWGITLGGAALAVGLATLTGCGLFKRMDAREGVGKSALALPDGSSLNRSSNGATALRLKKLFPDVQTIPEPNYYNPTVDDDKFTLAAFTRAFSTNLDRALTADGRPSSAIAQIALRRWASMLCKTNSGTQAGGAVFSKAGILLRDEAPPSSEAEWLALAAARNVWLSPYPLSDPQVQLLLKAYNDALASGASVADSKQMLCMAALLAPQFWIGNATKTDPLRKAALELGRTVPTMQDFDQFLHGELTLSAYVQRLQTDPAYKTGYLTTIREWHRDWWGIRDFMDSWDAGPVNETGFRSPAREPRSTYPSYYAQTSLVSPPGAYFGRYLSDGNPVVYPSSSVYASAYNPSDDQTLCQAENPGGAPRLQAFDPRTTLILFEHKNVFSAPQRWELVGAHVIDGALPEYEALVRAYDPGFSVSATSCLTDAGTCRPNCVRHNDLYPANWLGLGIPHPMRRETPGQPSYWECRGSVALPGGGFKPTDLRDFQHSLGSNTGPDSATYPYVYAPQYQTWDYSSLATRYSYVTANNNLIGTVHDKFGYGDRRIRRKAPSGFQDGVSEIKLWYTGTKAYACNAHNRYFLTCSMRPEVTDYQWIYASGWSLFGGVNEYMHDAAFFSPASAMNPYILNQMRCGVPNAAGLPRTGNMSQQQQQIYANDEAFFPHGYPMTSYLAGPVGTLNTLLNQAPEHPGYNYTGYYGTRADGTFGLLDRTPNPNHPEVVAIERLNRDINNEPLVLIDQVVGADRPYSDLFTTRDTYGHEEMELFYRTQGMFPPAYPIGYTPVAFDAPSRTQLKRMDRSSFPAIPLSWHAVRYPTNGVTSYPGFGIYYSSTPTEAVNTAGAIPPLPASGILGMPAFLGPVSQKMRTVSSRFFTRLLCGEPSVFVPSGSQAELHKLYMSDPSNPAPAAHLDDRSQCFACHVNLDPLGAALSKNFLPNVQKEYRQYDEMTGEFALLGGIFRGAGNRIWLGARSGGAKGEGAFLGEKVSGITEVGAVLARSPMMYSCVVNRAFVELYGRQPQLGDAKDVNKVSSDFSSHRNFNRMIRDLAGLKQFTRPPGE